jgi:ABC-type uncharacterized transport system substrate-binding protein
VIPRRRRLLLLSVAMLAAPLASAQRRDQPFRIGWPSLAPMGKTKHVHEAFEAGMRDHGYVVGEDVVVDVRSAEGRIERFPQVVKEVVASNPDVIITSTNMTTDVVRSMTQTIPIVMGIGTDVIAAGYAKSLAKPGGNITGITWDVGGEVTAKALELLREAAPKISRVAVLWEPPYEANYRVAIDKAARSFGLTTIWLQYSGDLDKDFADMRRQRADAMYALTGVRVWVRRSEVVALAETHRLPATYVVSEFVDAGGLMSYAPTNIVAFRAVARYVDKILRGANPGDLPIEQPSRIDLVINLRAAKALGLKIPRALLLRADRVIE